MIQVSLTSNVQAPAEKVWAVVGDFNAMPSYVEAVQNSYVEGFGIGSVRELTLADGSILREKLENHSSDTMTYEYSIVDGPLPIRKYYSSVIVTETESGCEVTWEGTFSPDGVSDDEASEIVSGVYSLGLAGLKKMFCKS